MAKELPYFKFEPSEYIAGNIQDCSYEAQGVFINICSLYWIRLGELPYASALQRICKGIPSALQELLNNKILSVENDQIIIDFLDEQLNVFQETSEKRANAANKRWSNANAMQVHSKSNAIREEKRREEKRKVEKIKEKKEGVIFPFDSEEFINAWSMWKEYKKKEHKFHYKSIVSEQAALKSLADKSNGNELEALKIIMNSIENGWKGFYKIEKNGNKKGFNPENFDLQGIDDYINGR